MGTAHCSGSSPPTLDLCPRRRKLPVLGEGHGVIGEPNEKSSPSCGGGCPSGPRSGAFAEAAGAADQAVGVCRTGEDQRVAWPRRQMGKQGAIVASVRRQHEVELGDVARLGLDTPEASPGRGERRPRRPGVALSQQDHRFADVGQGDWDRRRGPIIGLEGAGEECQRQAGRLHIGIPRGGGCCRQGKVVESASDDKLEDVIIGRSPLLCVPAVLNGATRRPSLRARQWTLDRCRIQSACVSCATQVRRHQ